MEEGVRPKREVGGRWQPWRVETLGEEGVVLADGGGEEGRVGNGGSAKQGVPAVQGVSCREWRRVKGGPWVKKCWMQAWEGGWWSGRGRRLFGKGLRTSRLWTRVDLNTMVRLDVLY